jgi:hypothetical protein
MTTIAIVADPLSEIKRNSYLEVKRFAVLQGERGEIKQSNQSCEALSRTDTAVTLSLTSSTFISYAMSLKTRLIHSDDINFDSENVIKEAYSLYSIRE